VLEDLIYDLVHNLEVLELPDDAPLGISVWEGVVEPDGEDDFKLEGSFRSVLPLCVQLVKNSWHRRTTDILSIGMKLPVPSVWLNENLNPSEMNSSRGGMP